MNIAKQLINNQVRNLIKVSPEYFVGMDDSHKLATAFTLIGVSSYLNVDIESANQYLTDGGGDGGIDAAFPANAIQSAVNTIKMVFDPEITTKLNGKSQAIVDEIHSLIYAGEIPNVIFVCMNNGIKWNKDGQAAIDQEFANQKQVSFEYFNCEDMVSMDSGCVKQNVSLPLSGLAVREDFNYKSVIVGRVSVSEIAELMKTYGDSILQKNIRYYLGSSKVNNGIRDTLRSPEDNSNFFFYNNGITIVCDKFDANFLQKENWLVKLDNMQIINGGQTCKTIESVIEENKGLDVSNAYVLVRIFQLDPDDHRCVNFSVL